MEYIAFLISCHEQYKEILIAEMAAIGFDSFLETDKGFESYAEAGVLNREALNAVFENYKEVAHLKVIENIVPKINWNQEWEKHYDPIIVENKVYIRADFHPKRQDLLYEILINPKMSFGTGHHATTYLMVQFQLNLDHQGKRVMDAGSGTGILAIMAKKLGAKEVVAFDIDEWSATNGNENFKLNGYADLLMKTGTIEKLKPPGRFDIILANINKNVLLGEMNQYSQYLSSGGHLLLSGFYQYDIEDLVKRADELQLHLLSQHTKNEWASILLVKT